MAAGRLSAAGSGRGRQRSTSIGGSEPRKTESEHEAERKEAGLISHMREASYYYHHAADNNYHYYGTLYYALPTTSATTTSIAINATTACGRRGDCD